MHILEKNTRLGKSVIWQLQEIAYRKFGPTAWACEGVPFYLTSNPLIAKQFVHVILGYVRDCIRKDAVTPLDFSEPLYIFDLGAGSGRLGYLVLKQLLPMMESIFSSNIKICYVMTDIVESNIAFWQKHSALQTYQESGVLDFAYYHHTDNQSITLIKSGRVLTKDSVINPIMLIGTYFFDTIPQDLFRVKNGRIEEGRVTITLPNNAQTSDVRELHPSFIMKLVEEHDYIPVEHPEQYYPDHPELNDLLLEYAQLFEEATFLFPMEALNSIRFFSDLSKGRLLLLAGDQGYSTEEQIKEWKEFKIIRHASFSMAVSYHALAKYFRNHGGMALLPSLPNTRFAVMSATLGGTSEKYPETSLAFRTHLNVLGPMDYYNITELKPEQLEELSLEHLLAFIKLGNWDPVNFHTFFPAVRSKIATAKKSQKENLCLAVYKVWEHFYPMHSKEQDFVMNLGVLLFELEKYEDALLFFQRALKMAGDSPTILMNISQCYWALNNKEAARASFQRALSLNPGL